jgi:hypothetical protein
MKLLYICDELLCLVQSTARVSCGGEGGGTDKHNKLIRET